MIARLEHMYLLDENILRFLTVQLDEKAIKARQQSTFVQPAVEPVAAPPEVVVEREPLFTDESDDAVPPKEA